MLIRLLRLGQNRTRPNQLQNMLAVRLAGNMRLPWSRLGNVLLFHQPTTIFASWQPKVKFLLATSYKPKFIAPFHRCARRIKCCPVLVQNVLMHISFFHSFCKPHTNDFLTISATPMMVPRKVKMMSSRSVSRRLVRRIPKMAPTQGAALRQLPPTAAHFLLMQKVCLRSGSTCQLLPK